jgi:hypothetical protein
MAYHITVVTNNSSSSVALTNPAYEGDSKLIGPSVGGNPSTYTPKRPVLINKISGNPTYASAMPVAVNIYTVKDNYCFWDNTNSAINGIGEATGAIQPLNASAGDIQMTINADGTISFARAGSSAAASGD